MINFLKYKFIYLAISLFVIFVGLFFILRFGLPISIDFVGGSNISYLLSKSPDKNQITQLINKSGLKYDRVDINKNVLDLKTESLSEKQENTLRKKIKMEIKGKVDLLLFESVGPSVGKEAINKTIIASILGVIAILIYIGIAFKGFNFAFSAILALFHDMLVLVSVYSVVSYYFHAEIDTLFITAALTTMSFSVHDTIVIFDKIREYIKEQGKQNIRESTNKALTETMVRSLNNSMTIVFMLLALILFGGSTIKFFIIALLIGTITGTYSSPFVAAPILVWLENRKKK